ncbi:MAG: hypothetical protein ACE5JZ_02490 [Kiloniellales bacterium]
MKGRLTWMWLGLATAAVMGLFALKLEVQSLEKELDALNQSIDTDVEAIHVLKAEWSFLNRPTRLQRGVDQYLDLRPVQADQVLDIGEVPARAGAGPSATLVRIRVGE